MVVVEVEVEVGVEEEEEVPRELAPGVVRAPDRYLLEVYRH